jgi:F-type H+-transporting ATPase subunit delta
MVGAGRNEGRERVSSTTEATIGAEAPAGGLASRYAGALYDIAADRRALPLVTDQMQGLGRLIDENDSLRRLLASPLVRIDEAGPGLRAALEQQGFDKLILDFVGVITANRRLRALRSIVSAYAALEARRRGVVQASVVTAHKLTDTQRLQLRSRLTAAGHGDVALTETVDPGLLGGLTLRVGSRLYDASIKSRLQRLAYRMKGAA